MTSESRPAPAPPSAGTRTERVVIVMPAYNAAKTLEDTFRAIPQGYFDEIVVVDDHSRDDTTELARRLNLKAIRHPHNVGYGGNQKTCYMEALRDGADIVIMLHPDGQYDPAIIPEMIQPIRAGRADMVLGSRFLNPAGVRSTGMPLWKIAGNRVLTGFENAVMGTHFSECHGNVSAYGVFAHRHAAEIEQELGVSVTFVPHLVPLDRGILETIYTRVPVGTAPDVIADAYRVAYEGAPFVRLTGGALPEIKHVAHTNFCDIGWKVDPERNRIVLVAIIDNLIKGAAGSAVQNLNVMLGLDERTGLL